MLNVYTEPYEKSVGVSSAARPTTRGSGIAYYGQNKQHRSPRQYAYPQASETIMDMISLC